MTKPYSEEDIEAVVDVLSSIYTNFENTDSEDRDAAVKILDLLGRRQMLRQVAYGIFPQYALRAADQVSAQDLKERYPNQVEQIIKEAKVAWS